MLEATCESISSHVHIVGFLRQIQKQLTCVSDSTNKEASCGFRREATVRGLQAVSVVDGCVSLQNSFLKHRFDWKVWNKPGQSITWISTEVLWSSTILKKNLSYHFPTFFGLLMHAWELYYKSLHNILVAFIYQSSMPSLKSSLSAVTDCTDSQDLLKITEQHDDETFRTEDQRKWIIRRWDIVVIINWVICVAE